MNFTCPHCKEIIYVYKEHMRPDRAASQLPKISIRDVEMTLCYLRGSSLSRTAVQYNRASATVTRVTLRTIRILAPDVYEECEGKLANFKRNSNALISILKRTGL